MFALISLLRQNPLAALGVGSASGFAAWLVSWGEHLALLFRLVGGFFGCLLAFLCFFFALPRLARFLRRWREKGFSQADGNEPPFIGQ